MLNGATQRPLFQPIPAHSKSSVAFSKGNIIRYFNHYTIQIISAFPYVLIGFFFFEGGGANDDLLIWRVPPTILFVARPRSDLAARSGGIRRTWNGEYFKNDSG